VRIDDDGYLTVVGRASDFIIRGGKNVSAAQVEHEVGSHPAIAFVAAVAVPDDVFGERVCVYVVLRPDVDRLALDDITAHLAERDVSKELWPEHLVVVDDLPSRLRGQDRQGRAARRHQAEAGAVTRVAVLDDYQDVARSIVEWPDSVEVTSFTDHLADEDQLVSRLQGFDVVVAMRERTAFPRSVLERLPDLRLLVTTGPRNAAIDVAAATAQGVVVSGTWGIVSNTVELTWALILAVARRLPDEVAAVRAGGWQQSVGFGPQREDAGRARPGQHRVAGGAHRPGVRHGRDRVERQHDR